ncbi:MAG: sigma 54-interacting transcriptional regulator, partial [Bacillota bacterium]|nr:sigma 54-interacting transcriptional regulator [Bacillota bacterium]
LITGQSGTGKNVLAKEIHKLSKRKVGPFISINCAAIPEQLLESELFGYRRGAFTGAEKSGKVGLVELANNGTLFLDEIGEIPISIQAKLLQLIQEHTFIPVGGNEQQHVNIRIIAATNRDLPKFIEEGKFREDLYYRLNVIEIEIPALKERNDDIVPLLYYFLNIYDARYNLSHDFTQESLDILNNYDWPGNIRELEHLIERLVITVQDTYILPRHLPQKVFKDDVQQMIKEEALPMAEPEKQVLSSVSTIPSPQKKSFKETEINMILQLYKKLKSSYKVAEELGVSQSKVTRVVRKYSS